jgi:hypothetical protein
MTVKVADMHVHVQRLVSVVKMVTMHECVTKERRSVVNFFVGKRMQWKCLSCKAVPP